MRIGTPYPWAFVGLSGRGKGCIWIGPWCALCARFDVFNVAFLIVRMALINKKEMFPIMEFM